MVVTWGKPLVANSTVKLQISWDECLQKCWDDSNCVLIYDTSPTCTYYTLERVTTVQKLTNGTRIAFRLLSRAANCSGVTGEPILKPGTVQSDVERKHPDYFFNQYLPFNITLKNNVWTFTPRSYPFVCMPPSIPIRRPDKNIWCMIMGNSGACINRTHANTICKTMFLQPIAGPANLEEYTYLRDSAVSYLDNPSAGSVPDGYERFGFWMDGIRKTECRYPQKAGVSCSGTNEFNYVDTNAKNPFLEWNPTQPDGLSRRTNADCVTFVAQAGNSGIDDLACEVASELSIKLCMIGYYCGSNQGPETWI
uniref:CW domain-containing protein n=1 Tax=Caenorhabditis tropicalis TaxID=1561998 RepID=A0A1I7UBM4_9PELO